MKSNNFLKDIIKLASSTIFVQLFSILTIPILTRFYSPETFGEFALIMSILGPLGVIVGFGFEPAIMIAKNDDEAKSLFHICLFATFIYTIFLFLILIASFFIFANKYTLEIILIIPIIIFLGGLSNALRYWHLRKNNITIISKATILAPLSDRITTLLLGSVGLIKSTSLIIGISIDAIVRPFFLLLGLRKSSIFLFTNRPNSLDLYDTVKKHIKFPLFIMPTNLFMRLTGDIPVYLLTFYFSSTIVGFYSLGLRLLNLPLALFAKSIGEIYFQRTSEFVNINNNLLEIIFKKLVTISFLPFFFLCFAGGDLIVYFLGSIWLEGGIYIQIFSIYYFIRFIFCIYDYLVIIKNKQQLSLVLNIILALFTVISIIIGGFFKNIFLTIMLISITNSLIYFYFSIKLYNECDLSLNKILFIISDEFLNLIVPIILFLFLRYILNVNVVIQFIFILLSFIIYKNDLFLSLKKYLNVK